jgi:hypothetical protein
MTETDKINIALAELYGWTEIHKNLGYKAEYCGTDSQGRLRDIPRYWEDAYTFEDLWPRLTADKKGQFVDELCEILKRENNPIKYLGAGTLISMAFFATARQRTEAMLRAFDKWKE